MFKFHYDGFQSLLCSTNDDPLHRWSKYVSLDASIKRVVDQSLNGDSVIEIIEKNERNYDCIPTMLTCPADPTDFINTNLPILVFVIKNLKLQGKIEFQFIDQDKHRRKFVIATNMAREKLPKITPTLVFLPFTLEDDWNLLEINLEDLSWQIFHTKYHSLQRLSVHPNFRLRRIYLLDRHYEHNETNQKDIHQAIMDIYALKKTLNYTDKYCQTQTVFLNSIPELSFIKKRRKKKIDVK